MHVTGGRDDRIHVADFIEEPLDADEIEQIDAMRTARGADFEDFVTRFEFGGDRPADRAGCTDDSDFHDWTRNG
jgi:hypothetical protein